MSDLFVGHQEQWLQGYKTAKAEDKEIIAKEMAIATRSHANAFLREAILSALKRILKAVEGKTDER